MTLKVASCRWIFLSLFFVVGLSVALTTHAETHLPVRAQSAALKAALIDTQNSYDATQSVVGKRRDDIVSTLSSSTDAERARILARRAEFAGRVKPRIHNLFQNVHERSLALISRFDQINGRLTTRITKQKNAGFGTSAAESAQREASEALVASTAALTDVSSIDLDHIVDAESPTDAFRTLREKMGVLHDTLARTETALLHTVTLLKMASAPPAFSSTSTASTTRSTH